MADWYYNKGGEQVGPIGAAELRQLAASGELQPDDLVWKDGMAEWAKASRVKGLFSKPGESPAGAPPPPDFTAQLQPMEAPIPSSQFVSPDFASGPAVAQGTSGMAIASLVCGILFCVPFSSILAIVFGIIGINQTGPGRRGRGLAITGLVLGSASILLVIPALLISILLPALNKARQQAQQIKSAANEKNIGLAIMMYENANKGALPPDMITLATTQSLDPSFFVSPASNDTPAPTISALESGGHDSYIYVGAGLVNPGMNAVLLYEKPGTFPFGSNVLFGDGHVEWVTNGNLQSVLGAGK